MGKEVILRILFCLESFQMMSNGERKYLLFFLFSQLSQDLLYSFEKFVLCRKCVVYPKNEVMAFPKIKIKWD